MTSTLRHTLFHLTLVLIIQMYTSVLSDKHRHRRAILDEVSNHTAHVQKRMTHTLETVAVPVNANLSTIPFNTTLTSEERYEQMQKLKDAENYLRKNLREKGKEYENQLYENWPNLLAMLKKDGPFSLLEEDNKYLWERFQRAGFTLEMLVTQWDTIMQLFKDRGTQTFLKMVDKYKKDETVVTLSTSTLPPRVF